MRIIKVKMLLKNKMLSNARDKVQRGLKTIDSVWRIQSCVEQSRPFLPFSFSHRTVIPRPVLLTQYKANMRWTPVRTAARIALFYRAVPIKQDKPRAEISFTVGNSTLNGFYNCIPTAECYFLDNIKFTLVQPCTHVVFFLIPCEYTRCVSIIIYLDVRLCTSVTKSMSNV